MSTETPEVIANIHTKTQVIAAISIALTTRVLEELVGNELAAPDSTSLHEVSAAALISELKI